MKPALFASIDVNIFYAFINIVDDWVARAGLASSVHTPSSHWNFNLRSEPAPTMMDLQYTFIGGL